MRFALKQSIVTAAFLFGLPLLLVILSGLQIRGIPNIDGHEQRFPILEAAWHLEFDYILKAGIPPEVRRTLEERGDEVKSLMDSVEYNVWGAEYHALKKLRTARFAPPLAAVSMGGALLSLAFSLGGVLFIRHAGKRSLDSRQALFKWFGLGRRLLPFMLLGASLPLILSMIGAALL